MKTEINRYIHEGIPVVEYTNNDSDKLIYVNHGIFGNKDQVMLLVGKALLRAGYRVVAIDAAKHGDRQEPPFDDKNNKNARVEMFDVVHRSAHDILKIHHDIYAENYASFDALGISMGGYTVYYLAMQSQAIDTIVAMISSPSFFASGIADLLGEKSTLDQRQKQELERQVRAIDPAQQPEEIRAKRIIALNGSNDTVVPPEHAQTFKNDNPQLPVQVELFDTAHQISQAMTDRAIQLLQTR